MSTHLPPQPRVLVVTKSSALDVLRKSDNAAEVERVETLLEEDDPSVRRIRESHTRHRASVVEVRRVLAARGWPADVRNRADVHTIEGYDLVMTVGGDGTVLDVSHRLPDQTPLLGVNSDPQSSVGYFCATTAAGLAATLDQQTQGELSEIHLQRFALTVAGERVTQPVLNDVLISDVNPAATSRYILEVAGHSEVQRSSGLWVSTPAGSTAAIRSAGGIVLPLGSELLQYLVREPCLPRVGRYNLLGGVQPMADGLAVTSMMRTGRVYLDGPHHSYALGMGDRVEISGDAPPLVLLGIDESRRFS